MTAADLNAIGITAQLAAITTIVLLVLGTPLAWWLSRTTSAIRPIVETLTALPLVLPPTVLGFYMLILFSPTAPLGGLIVDITGSALTFSFTGLVVASVLYSVPFMVQPLQVAFEGVSQRLLETAYSLGASPMIAFFTVVVPASLRGIVTGLILTFAHTVGEFGVVLMVGGNIPGETRVVSIAIFEHVETVQYRDAHYLAGLLLVFSIAVLLIVYFNNHRYRRRIGIARA